MVPTSAIFLAHWDAPSLYRQEREALWKRGSFRDWEALPFSVFLIPLTPWLHPFLACYMMKSHQRLFPFGVPPGSTFWGGTQATQVAVPGRSTWLWLRTKFLAWRAVWNSVFSEELLKPVVAALLIKKEITNQRSGHQSNSITTEPCTSSAET